MLPLREDKRLDDAPYLHSLGGKSADNDPLVDQLMGDQRAEAPSRGPAAN